MATPGPRPQADTGDALRVELQALVMDLAQAIVDRSDLDAAQDQLESFLGAVLAMGIEPPERDPTTIMQTSAIGTVLLSRVQPLLHQRLASLWDSKAQLDLDKAVDWVAGASHSLLMLVRFGTAMTRVINESGVVKSGRDFSFAGNSDFIPINEVIQLLGGGKHRGVLVLEKEDLELDIYFENSLITFISPHQLGRRILPAREGMPYKEVPATVATLADRNFGIETKPLAITLAEEGIIRKDDIKRVCRYLGTDTLFSFMREGTPLKYRYYRLGDLPEFALEHGMFMPCTPLLLEINKKIDDWLSMQKIFPYPDAVLEPAADLFQTLGSMNLDVVDLKVLTQLQEGLSANQLAAAVGMPLHEVYELLMRFARDGLLRPQCDASEFAEYLLTVEEDEQAGGTAAEAAAEVSEHADLGSALDSILGGGDDVGLAPSDSLKLN